jgi:hypothetical protein
VDCTLAVDVCNLLDTIVARAAETSFVGALKDKILRLGMCSNPICFNIYIHDILSVFVGVEGVEFLFYADDIVFY